LGQGWTGSPNEEAVERINGGNTAGFSSYLMFAISNSYLRGTR
jgi:hypothetical protein